MIPRIEIDHETCDKEGLCVQICADGVFEKESGDSFPVAAHPMNCSLCGHCVAVCPGDAITHYEMDMANFLPYPTEMDIEPDRLLNFMRFRRSIRNYNQKRPVRKETVQKLIDAARYAPTGCNVQSLKYIIVEDREVMEELAVHCIEILRKNATLCRDEDALSALETGLADRLRANLPFDERIISEVEAGLDPIFYQAPVLVIIHANVSVTPCPLEDATLAAYHMMLMAQSLGLGTCYNGSFYEYANESQAILEALAIPPNNKILMAFNLGYPAIRFRRMVDRNEPEVQWIG
jgi:nitroreductase/NAD-dependent dihydropyrimidine dehydrogenase PreA subunit